jgi:hypothetical protein
MADLTKDPFEEFEFKPINEGLGFHRKQRAASIVPMPAPPAQPAPAARSSQNFNLTPPAANTGTAATFAAPLPRYNTPLQTSKSNFNIPVIEDDSIAKAQTAVNEILRNLNQKRQLDFASESQRMQEELRKSRPYIFAATLDGMLILAGFLLSMIIMLTVTRVDLFLNLTHPETSGLIYLATGLLFAAVSFVYMVVNRAFLGFTPGEWAFDQRLGKTSDMESLTYIPRIALRTVLVMATGFVTMQLLSYLFNKDIAGQITGITLFRKANA